MPTAPAFDIDLGPRLVFGDGAVHRLPELADELKARSILIVTDAGLVKAGHVSPVADEFRAAGSAVKVFDGVRENPSTSDVDRCAVVAREVEADLFIGLGGGSSLDTAKGANFLLTNGGRMEDYWGHGLAKLPLRPMIAVPTTAGTGSEVQSFALISQEGSHRKMACGDASARPKVAVLDPRLTISLPRPVTAQTGLDTMTHAVESFVTKKRNPVSCLYAKESLRYFSASFETVLGTPDDVVARGEMLLAAAFAGLAIEASMLGAAHALANPLTACFDLEHGRAVGLMLPSVVRFNSHDPEVASWYAELATTAFGRGSTTEDLIARIGTWLDASDQPDSLVACGVTSDRLGELATLASEQWTGQFNPRPVDSAALEALYRSASERAR
ncbi:MAG: iron-containing alcohol dehydrogenase [Planctomycetota bacterium]